MAYTITLTSAVEKINNTDTVQIILIFSCDLIGINKSYSFAEKDIRIADWGEKEMAYDLEDALLVPATYKCALTDAAGYLEELFFGMGNEGINTHKNPKLVFMLNGVSEYEGVVQEDGVDYDKASLRVVLSADPNTSILNKTQLFNESGAALNPLNLPQYGLVSLKDTILKAYQLVNPNVSLSISHDWLFTGVKNTTPGNVLDNIVFDELRAYPQCFVLSTYPDVSNVGDVLRKLAIDFCAFTGMNSFNEAFFNKLFCYDAGNLQTMGLKLSHKLRYWYQLIDYIYVNINIVNNFSAQYSQGTENIYVNEGKLKRQLFTGFRMREDYTTLPFPVHDTQILGTVARGGDTDGVYEVYAVKDPSLDNTWRDNGDLVARFWYYYRNKMPRMRIDSMSFSGITYSFMKNFNDGVNKYQIIKMRKKYSANTTEIDALHLGVI